jgi:hypothetical protein
MTWLVGSDRGNHDRSDSQIESDKARGRCTIGRQRQLLDVHEQNGVIVDACAGMVNSH